MSDRMKVKVLRASPAGQNAPWYAAFVGKKFWVAKDSFNGERYNLKYRRKDLTIRARDVRVINLPWRKLFHAVNCELPQS